MKKISMKKSLENIGKNIDSQKTEIKLKDMIDKYNKNNADLKMLNSGLFKLKHMMSIESECEDIDDDIYEVYMDDIKEENIKDIFDCDDLEQQIKLFKIFQKKTNSCMNYLKQKKLNIIDCDKIVDLDDNDDKTEIKKPVKKNEKKKTEKKMNNKKKLKEILSTSNSSNDE